MADNFKLIIEAAIAKAKSDANIKEYVKEVQGQIKDLNIDVKVSDANVKSAIKEVNKLTQEGSTQNIKSRREELRLQKQKFAEEQFNIKRNLVDQQNVFKTSKQSINEEITNRKQALQLQKLQTSESKLQQQELTKVEKVNQDAFNLKADKNILDNKLSSYLQENSKLSDGLKNRLIEIQKQVQLADKTKLGQLKKSFQEVSSEAKSLNQTGGTAFQSLFKHAGELVGFLGATTLVIGGYRQIQNMIAEVTNLNKSLVDLQQATGFSNQQTQELLNTYIDLGQQLGATGTEVADAASSWLKQGKSIADTNTLIKDSMILSKVGTLDSASSTKYLTAITKAYQISVEDTLGVVDKLSAVDMASATDVSGLSEAVSSVSANAQSVGISLDKILGIVATIGETSGEAMSSVGNSVSTMLSRMANIKLSRLTDPETGEDLSNVETSLRNVGIELRSDDKTFKNFGDVLDTVASKWSTYSDVTQRTIASSIAGKDHMNDFLILMKAYDTSLKYTTVSTQSSGEAMIKFSAYEEGIEAKTKKVQASLQELASDTLDSQVIKSFLDFSNVLINATDSIGIFNIALTVLAGVIGAKTSLGLTSFANSITIAIGKMGVASGVAETLGMALGTMIPTIALLGGIAALTKLVDVLVVTKKEQAEIVNKSKQDIQSLNDEISSINSELDETNKKISDLLSQDKLTILEKSELDNLIATREELDRILAVKKETLEIENQQYAKEAEKQYDKSYGDFNTYNPQMVEDSKITNNSFAPSTDDINAIIGYYEQMSDAKDKALDNTTIENYNGYIDDAKEKMSEWATDATEVYKNLLLIDESDRTESQKQKIDNLAKSIDYVNSLLDKNYIATKKTNAFNDIYNTDGFKTYKTELEELAKAGTLDANTISSNKEYQKLISNTGMTAEEVSNQIYDMVEETKASGDSASDTSDKILSLTDALTALSKGGELLSSVKDEIKDTGKISTDTLQSIIDKYPDLESVVADYLAGRIKEKDLVKSLKSAYDTDYENYRNTIIEKKKLDGSFYKEAVSYLSDDVKEKAKSYGIDFGNFKNTEEAKLKISQMYALKVAELNRATLVSTKLLAEGSQEAYGDSLINVSKFVTPALKAVDDLESIAKGFDTSLDSALNLKDYTPKGSGSSSSKSGSGSSDKTKNTFSQVFDWISIRIEKLKDKAQKAIDSVSKYATTKAKTTQIDVAIQAKIDEKSSLKTIEDSYNKLANKVGLSKKYRDLVNNGGLKVETIKDEKLANKIEEYQKYRDAAKEVKEQISGINDEIDELQQQKLELPIAELEKLNDKLQDDLDSLNKIKDDYNTVINAVVGAVDDEINSINEQKTSQENYYDSLIKNKQTELDLLQKTNTAREEQLQKEQALYDLERAKNQKSNKVYREGQGIVYEANTNSIREAQNTLDNLTFDGIIKAKQEEIDALEKTKESALESYDTQIEKLDEIKNKWSEIASKIEELAGVQLADGLLGEGWQNRVLNGDTSDFNLMESIYGGVETQIQNIQDQIDRNNQVIKSINEYVTAWQEGETDITTALSNIDTAQTTAQENEASSLSTRITNMRTFAEEYVALANTIANASSSIEKVGTTKATSNTKTGGVISVGKSHSGMELGYIGDSNQSKDEFKMIALNKLSSDEIPRVLKIDEAVLTKLQQQNVMSNLFTSFQAGIQTQLPQFTTKNTQQQPSLIFNGTIHLHEVQNVDGLSDAIKTELLPLLKQKLY